MNIYAIIYILLLDIGLVHIITAMPYAHNKEFKQNKQPKIESYLSIFDIAILAVMPV